MTEAEWLACEDPTPMLEFLKGKASDRKLRLFAVGLCRLNQHSVTDERWRRAVALVERIAEGAVLNEQQIDSAWRDMMVMADEYIDKQAIMATEDMTPVWLCWVARRGVEVKIDLDGWLRSVARRKSKGDDYSRWIDKQDCQQSEIIGDIFGNQFRPVVVDPNWLTFTVLALAEGIYAEKAFDRMPILADALQDAGCDNDDILNHCRNEGVHVRGCWVVDLILGKS